jgi:hypothetical protein
MTRSNSGGPATEDDVLELDADSNPVRSGDARPSIERFIRGEIYRNRSDVTAIVHTHAPALIPFGASTTALRTLFHMRGFLEEGAPVFDIRKDHGVTNMLTTTGKLGQARAASLGTHAGGPHAWPRRDRRGHVLERGRLSRHLCDGERPAASRRDATRPTNVP